MSNEIISREDIEAMEIYLREQKIAMARGEAIRKGDFTEWVRLNAVWVLDKLEQAWKWFRKMLGLDL